MVIAVRRCAFKDYFYEITGTAPDRWSIVAGGANWTIQASTLQFLNLAGAGNVSAPCENGAICGIVRQFGKMIYYVTMTPIITAGGWYMAMVFFATASNGAWLGTSYVIRIDANNITLYKSTANVLGAPIAQTASAHIAGTSYAIVVTYDSSTGNWTITENGTTKITISAGEHTLTGGSYIGLGAVNVDGRFSACSLCNDWEPAVASVSVFHKMSVAVSEATVKLGCVDASGTVGNFLEGDGIEIYLCDDTKQQLDFWGRVERIDLDSSSQLVLTCYDWRKELLDCEGIYAIGGGGSKLDAAMQTLISNNVRTLRNGAVQATVDAPAVRNLKGEDCYVTLWRLAQAAGFAIWQDPDGKFNITNIYADSGIAMDESGIMTHRWVKDLGMEVNTLSTYYTGGGHVASGGSGSSYQTAKKQKIIIDPRIPDAANAAAVAAYWINNYGTGVPVIDVYIMKGWKLAVGQTGTITYKPANLTAQAFLCIEKEYQIPEACGVRVRLVLSAAFEERHRFSFVEKVGMGIRDGREALGIQV